MVKWISIFLLFFYYCIISFAQGNAIWIIEGYTPKLYLVHVVVLKKIFTALEECIIFAANDIASYNNLQFENGLSVGQSLLKIPLTENNFLQSGSAGTR